MTSRETTTPGSAVAASFREDLRTDWIPDVLGGTDALELMAARAAAPASRPEEAWLDVHTPSGERRVPLIDLGLRLALHLAVDRAVSDLERTRLSPSVCGYRDAGTPYEDEFIRHQQQLKELANEYPVILHADIRDYFASVQPGQLLNSPWCDDALAALLTELHDRVGHVLFPGNRWARRLANVYLMPVDALIDVPFLRWQDDYYLFLRDIADVDRSLDCLRRALAAVQMTLSAAKTGVASHDSSSDPHAHALEGDRSLTWILNAGIETRNRRFVRYAIARLTRHRDPAGLQELVRLVRGDPSLLPRAAWYLDALLPDPSAFDITLELFDRTDDWFLARLYPLAVRHGALARALPVSLRERGTSHGLPMVRDLSCRVEFALGGNVWLSDRLTRWAKQGGDHRDDLPMVETRL